MLKIILHKNKFDCSLIKEKKKTKQNSEEMKFFILKTFQKRNFKKRIDKLCDLYLIYIIIIKKLRKDSERGKIPLCILYLLIYHYILKVNK